jgi:hypothetical protein
MKFSAAVKLLPIVLLLFGLASCLDRPSQIAKVNYDFSGCFGGGEGSLTIFNNGTNFTAKLEGYEKNILNTNISIKQLDTFKMFVIELKNLSKKKVICTTVSHYTVYYQNEVIKKTNDACWEGFEKLIDCLFRSPSYLTGTN